jgi:hypothetical protein
MKNIVARESLGHAMPAADKPAPGSRRAGR